MPAGRQVEKSKALSLRSASLERMSWSEKMRRAAVVARVPKQAIQKIIWAKPPPAGPEGDGLVVVRTADDPGSAVVLFLRGHEVVSGTPTGFWQIPLL